MSKNTDKDYVQSQINRASSTDNEFVKNDALYRAGTQMEVIKCDGNSNLTQEQQQTVIDAASRLIK